MAVMADQRPSWNAAIEVRVEFQTEPMRRLPVVFEVLRSSSWIDPFAAVP